MKRTLKMISRFIICAAVIIFIYLATDLTLTVHATAPEDVANGVVYRSDGTLGYYTAGVLNTSIDGLVYIEDLQKWLYFENGIVNTDLYEFVYYNGGWFLVANGEVADLTGLVLYDGYWYYLAHGQLIDYYEGLTLYDGEWFYVKNGMLATDVTGLYWYDGETFLVAEGHLLTDYTGLYQNSNGYWHWIVEGRKQQEYSGPVEYDGKRFFVQEGIMRGQSEKVMYKGEVYILCNGEIMTGWENVPNAEIYGYVVGDVKEFSDGKSVVYLGDDTWRRENGLIAYTSVIFADSEEEFQRGRLRWAT